MIASLTELPFRPSLARDDHRAEVRGIAVILALAYAGGSALALANGLRVSPVNLAVLAAACLGYALASEANARHVERGLLLINLAAVLWTSLHTISLGVLFYYIAAVVHIVYSERSTVPRILLLTGYVGGFVLTLCYITSAAYAPAPPALRFAFEYSAAGFSVAFLCYSLRRFRASDVRTSAELAARSAVLDEHARAWREGREALLRKAAEIEGLKVASRRSIGRERAARAQIEAQGEEMRQFAYAASHDLKEPVRTIRSFVQMTRRRLPADYVLPAESAEFFDHIDASTAGMAALLDRLLAYSRAERAPAEPRPTTPARLFYPVSGRDRVEVAPAPEALAQLGLPVARERFDAILAELVDNALRFSDAVVTVGIRECPAGAEVYVRDRGIGIPPEYRERVFGLFQRLHARDAYPGHGIGLALCRRLLGGEHARLRLLPVEGGGTEAVLLL